MSATEDEDDLSLLLDAPVAIGLRAQGHLPTVRKMLEEGSGWGEIGKAIGWHPVAAKEWYEREDLAEKVREACAEKVGQAGCRCRELKDSRWGLQDGNPCSWCGRPKEEHGPEEPGIYDLKGGRLCPRPDVSSQYYCPNGEPVVLQHSPACPKALAKALREWR